MIDEGGGDSLPSFIFILRETQRVDNVRRDASNEFTRAKTIATNLHEEEHE